jgi:hypothetical protein
MESIKTLIMGFVMILVGLMILGTVASSVWTTTYGTTRVVNETHDIGRLYNNTDNSSYSPKYPAVYNLSTRVFMNQMGAQCLEGGGRWVSGSFSMVNITGATINSGNWTVDYANQNIAILNTTDTDKTLGGSFAITNNTLWTYSYFPREYMCSGFGRTMLNLVPGFFGLALLLGGIAMFYKIARDEGIANL